MLRNLVLSAFFSIFAALAVAEDIRIGWIGPLTGNSAVLGIDSAKAISMVFKHTNDQGGINGHKLSLVVEDDQYKTAKTVTAYRKLVSVDKIKFIFVVTYGGLFAIADEAQRDNVVLVDPLDCDERVGALNRNVLCVAKTTESLGTLAADDAIERGNLPAAILYLEGDPFPKVTAEHARKQLTKRGHAPALFEGYSSGVTDFRALLGRIKALNAKSLFMYGYDEMGLLTRQAKELGIATQIYTFGTVTSPGFLSSARDSADGAVVVMWQGEGGERLQRFLASFEKEVGRQPFLHISTVPSYDIAEILASSLAKGALDDDGNVAPEKVLSDFYGLRNYSGVSGPITMDADGVTRSFTHSVGILQGSKVVSRRG